MALRKVHKKPRHIVVKTSVKSLQLEKRFEDHLNVAELDLIKDLDDEFFNNSYELVQKVFSVSSFAAGKLKQYVDLLARMHSHYSEEVAASTELKTKVDEAEAKFKLTLELTGTTTDMIEKMQESLTEAWLTADAAQDREAMMYGNLEYAHSDQPTKHGMDLAVSKNQNEMRFRGMVFRERDRLARELKEHQKRLETNRLYSASMEAIIDEHRSTISKQQIRLKHHETEVFKMEHKLRMCEESFQEKIIQQRREIEALDQANQNLRIFEKKFTECKTLNETLMQLIKKLSHDNFAMQKINHRNEEEIHHVKSVVNNLESDNRALRREKIELDLRGRANLRDIKSKEEIYTVLSRRFQQLTKKNNEQTEQELILNNELLYLEKKVTILTGKLEDTQRQKEEGDRGLKKMRTEISSLNDTLASVRFELNNQRGKTQDVQVQLDRAYITLDEKDAMIHKVTKERNDLLGETNELNRTIETLEENVAGKTLKLNELQEQLQLKLKDFQQVKQQMEMLHAEKSMLQKSFAVCGQDRQTLQNINTKQVIQINQLCNQVAAHEKDANILKNQIEQLHTLVKHKQIEIHGKERQLKSLRMELYEMKMRSGQLQHTIAEDEKRFKQISISLEEERKNKSLMGHQIMRRNGELRVLQEKLSMMQLALNNGTVQYNRGVEDVRLLKTEIINLRMSKDCLERAVSSTANMRHEVVRLERQLLRERLNVAAFTEEMKHPCRIHRWRIIRGKDPHKFELICKIQSLLKRNIRLTVERRNLETKVQEAQLLYDTLKQQMQYVADPNINERLWLQKRINQRQNRKVKAMKAELAINEIDLQTRDVIIGEYQTALIKLKKPNRVNVQVTSPNSKVNSELYTKPLFQSSSST